MCGWAYVDLDLHHIRIAGVVWVVCVVTGEAQFHFCVHVCGIGVCV